MTLEKGEQEQLLEYIEAATYVEGFGYIFGPAVKKTFQNLYNMLDKIGIGFHSSYVNSTRVNDEKADIQVFVIYKQATRLAEALDKMVH
jgi:hypothetical protein